MGQLEAPKIGVPFLVHLFFYTIIEIRKLFYKGESSLSHIQREILKNQMQLEEVNQKLAATDDQTTQKVLKLLAESLWEESKDLIVQKRRLQRESWVNQKIYNDYLLTNQLKLLRSRP